MVVDKLLEKWVKQDISGNIPNKSWYEGTLDKLMTKYDLESDNPNLGADLETILNKQKKKK
jgi:hypothetical protein